MESSETPDDQKPAGQVSEDRTSQEQEQALAQFDVPAARTPFSNTSVVMAAGGAVVAALLLFVVFFAGSDAEPQPVDSALAELAFLNADGSNGSLADYAGQPLVVNFFASWCPPCRAELPEFEAVHQANQGAVTFLGVSHDLDEVTWKGLVEETQITYDTVFQPGSEIFTELSAKGMPTTAFLSPDGEVLQVWTGILSGEKLQELIDENLVDA